MAARSRFSASSETAISSGAFELPSSKSSFDGSSPDCRRSSSTPAGIKLADRPRFAANNSDCDVTDLRLGEQSEYGYGGCGQGEGDRHRRGELGTIVLNGRNLGFFYRGFRR